MSFPHDIRGLLIDLDGTLYIGDQLLPGAVEAVANLKEKGFACRFLTNTSTRSLESLHKKVTALGLPIERDEIISATQAAVLYLRQLGSPTCHLLLNDDPLKDFAEFERDDINPDYVVIGDMAKSWNWEMLNDAFNMITRGAKLLALHKGKYWQTEEGLRIDIGVFVSGLEYATGVEAIVVGKPSSLFFELGLKSLSLGADEVVMVGDDLDSDIGGAQAAGISGVLVKTGKYREELAQKSSVRPGLVAASFSDFVSQLI